ncbi:beta-lactamase family protein [Kordiimonas sp. SCSIO 12610]|uniref:beta-lactamase family protein n=1 Tax=Kordiimonas sp. SCSIO 12610 TaxID=2829597 RepID=UPI0021099D27|nr:beta-lactamase family protein [Kordiimonas sp. SCSIO 12610]UTW56661.1 class A beta-lactamase-related serine hydrolase [Kordiimonas sp. SCSIO 12610]
MFRNTLSCKFMIALAVFISQFALPAGYADDHISKKLNDLITTSYERGLFNGNILVVKGDQVLLEKSLGYFDGSRSKLLDENSVFNSGSIAKEFNAVAIMMLVEQGKISLEDTVSKYFPDLPEWVQTVQVKHLLNYTSGLPRVRWRVIKNHDDAFADLKQVQTLPFVPGEGYLYSNNNVFLQRMIVEKVTGNSFGEFAKEFILKPAGMTTALVDPVLGEGDVPVAFNNDFKNDPDFDLPIKGWVLVTAKDMVAWFRALHSHRLVSEASVKTLFASYSPRELGALGRSEYSNGGTLQYHQHHGSSVNYEALVTYRAAEDTAIILLTNNKNRKLFELTQSIEAILDGKAYQVPKKPINVAIAEGCAADVKACLAKYDALKASDFDLYDFENENALNTLGYQLLRSDNLEAAIEVFKRNVAEFPGSANPYDSLGEAYVKARNPDLALFNYQKSLELNPDNKNAVDMIKKIKEWVQSQ